MIKLKLNRKKANSRILAWPISLQSLRGLDEDNHLHLWAESDQEDTGSSWNIPRAGAQERATLVTKRISRKSYWALWRPLAGVRRTVCCCTDALIVCDGVVLPKVCVNCLVFTAKHATKIDFEVCPYWQPEKLQILTRKGSFELLHRANFFEMPVFLRPP